MGHEKASKQCLVAGFVVCLTVIAGDELNVSSKMASSTAPFVAARVAKRKERTFTSLFYEDCSQLFLSSTCDSTNGFAVHDQILRHQTGEMRVCVHIQ
jgi:hypothetical protein